MYYKEVINPDIRRIINNKNVDNLEINPSDLAIDVDTIAAKLGLKIKYVVINYHGLKSIVYNFEA